MNKIHDMFHVSLNQKAYIDPSWIFLQVPQETKEDMTLEVRLVKILDESEKGLRSKKIRMINVLWRNSQIEEETWEEESKIRKTISWTISRDKYGV